MTGAGRRAVFLDKDGTLVDDVPYNVDPDLVRLAPGAMGGLSRLTAAGYALVLVTNQSGVARGLFEASALDAVWARLAELLAAQGLALDSIHFCPHHPGGSVPAYAAACDCRKPAPGMLRRAAAERGWTSTGPGWWATSSTTSRPGDGRGARRS